MINRVKGDRNKAKVGSSKEQEIDGIPTIEYGWVDKKDRRIFYSIIGVHCLVRHDEPINTFRIENRLKGNISKLIMEFFCDIKFSIVDVDVPINFNKSGKGFMDIEIMIHNRSVVGNDRIEEFNGKVVDILKEVKEFSIHKKLLKS